MGVLKFASGRAIWLYLVDIVRGSLGIRKKMTFLLYFFSSEISKILKISRFTKENKIHKKSKIELSLEILLVFFFFFFFSILEVSSKSKCVQVPIGFYSFVCRASFEISLFGEILFCENKLRKQN